MESELDIVTNASARERAKTRHESMQAVRVPDFDEIFLATDSAVHNALSSVADSLALSQILAAAYGSDS